MATGQPDAWQVCFTYYGQLISPQRMKSTSYAIKCCSPSSPQTQEFEEIETSGCIGDAQGDHRLLSHHCTIAGSQIPACVPPQQNASASKVFPL